MEAEFDRALHVLQRYISPVNARSVLIRALQQQGIARDDLSRTNLRKCESNLRRAATLFVDANRLEAALREIGELCGTASDEAHYSLVQIVTEADVAKARAEARRICDLLGVSPFTMQKFATIVSELARNMVLYAGGGRIEVTLGGAGTRRIAVQATDHGPGIPNLTEIMAGRYKSRTGLGRGLTGTKRLADRFDITTDKGGTRIVAEVFI